MDISLSLSRQPLASFEALIRQLPNDAFASPKRSTVPLIQYWRQPEEGLKTLWNALELPQPDRVELAFEFPTAVQAGRGKASFTDLMVIADRAAIAIEAKYTEPRYETVGRWLGPKPTDNRYEVLEGWLRAIGRIAEQRLSVDAVRELPYQIIHRTASACCVQRKTRAVVYQVFGVAPLERYADDLRTLASLLAPSKNISFWVHSCRLTPSASLHALVSRWESGGQNMAEDVRSALLVDSQRLVASATLTRITA